jgi:hypothetical protein
LEKSENFEKKKSAKLKVIKAHPFNEIGEKETARRWAASGLFQGGRDGTGGGPGGSDGLGSRLSNDSGQGGRDRLGSVGGNEGDGNEGEENDIDNNAETNVDNIVTEAALENVVNGDED